MSMLHVDIEVTDAFAALRRLESAIDTPSLAHYLRDDVSDFYRNDIESRFEEEGDALSGFWPPLQDATVEIKKNEPFLYGAPDDINIRTGEMFEALTGDYDLTVMPGYAQLDIPGNVSGSVEEKIRTAQFGAPNPRPIFSPTPPRPVLATSAMQLGFLLEMLEVHVIRTMMTGMSL